MKVAYKDSLTYKMLQRIQTLSGNVVLRKDVADMAARRQVSYALNQLINKNELVRIGYGVYAKAYRSEYREDMIILRDDFATITRETLDRLNVAWEAGSAEREYNEGLTTQVPVRSILKLKSRFRRKLAYRSMVLKFEKNKKCHFPQTLRN